MRALVALCFVGCAGPHHEPVVDGPTDAPPDVAGNTCSSAGGTANVVVRTVGPTKVYDRVYAGGILSSGPVNGVSSFPFSLQLVFANQTPVPVCCTSPDSSCCGLDALSAEVDLLPNGGELGSHAANVFGVGFSAMGTLTIADWIQPFDVPPGRITGSLSVSTSTVSIDGTFDNVFCAEMLGATI